MKAKAPPSQDALRAAFVACMNGRGSALARIIKGLSVEDLSKGLSYSGTHHDSYAFSALSTALVYASGRKEERARTSRVMRDIRKRDKLARKELQA